MEIGDTTTGDILEFHQISKTKLETEMEIGDATTGEDNVPDDNDDALNSIATLYDSFSDEGSEPNPDVHPEPFHILGFDYADVEDPLTSIALLYASDDEDLSGGSAVISIDNFHDDNDDDEKYNALNSIATLYDSFSDEGSEPNPDVHPEAFHILAFNPTSRSSSGISSNGSIDGIDSDVDQNFAALNNIAILYATDGSSEDGDQNFAALNSIAILYATDDSSEDGDQNIDAPNIIALLYSSSSEENPEDFRGFSGSSSDSDMIDCDMSNEFDNVDIELMTFEQDWDQGYRLSSEDDK